MEIILRELLTVPSSFMITEYHVIFFAESEKTGITVKRSSTGEKCENGRC